ncbi:unnamed protein product [Arabis nemorensis]|uniref:DUF287 domain-containing protein n=1 Tax=Arabis nemorensis TaxID=586526 RepID=A0A565BSL3_9BRAS|nr:unnamed protein product [Arabis nemorensis]
MVETVPALTEVDQVNCSSSSYSEAEGDDDGEDDKESPGSRISLSPGYARDASVDGIIADDGEIEVPNSTYGWDEEIEDVQVENRVKLINEERAFHSEIFVGGATKADLIHMRKEEEEKNAKAKQRKAGVSVEEGNVDTDRNGCFDIDFNVIAELISSKMKEEFSVLGLQVNSCIKKIEVLKSKLDFLKMDITDGLDTKFDQMLTIMKEHISNVVSDLCQKGTSFGGLSGDTPVLPSSEAYFSPNANNVGDNPAPGLDDQENEADRVINSVIEEIHNSMHASTTATEDTVGVDNGVADISLGDVELGKSNLSVEGQGGAMDVDCNGKMETVVECDPVGTVSHGDKGDVDCVTEAVEELAPDSGGICRKSKRQKTIPPSLVDDYQCDMHIVQ